MARTLVAGFILCLWVAQQVSCGEQVYLANNWAQAPLETQNGTVANCHEACRSLLNSVDLISYYPDLPSDFRARFFAAQQIEKVPVCSVEPRSAGAVSRVVRAVREHHCPFAIKSGGHGSTSNIEGGLLLDLRQLDGVVLSDDGATAAIGPGARWGDVYGKLQPHGRVVTGGRVPSVGVGGFLMGGGISFLTPQLGWAFDNVRSFEVVLPDGSIVNASRSSHSDIYVALRGGGSSFGIVTCFQLETHPNTTMWGTMAFNYPNDLAEREARLGIEQDFKWTWNSFTMRASTWLQRLMSGLGFGVKSSSLVHTVVKLNAAKAIDIVPQAYMALTWVPYVKAYLVGSIYYSSSNHPSEAPIALKDLTVQPMAISAYRQDDLAGFAAEQGGYSPTTGARHSWWTSTFKLDVELLNDIWDIFIAENHDLMQKVPDAMTSNNVQFISHDQIANGARNGGNAFGLEAKDGPLFMFSITVEYNKAEDDSQVRQTCLRIINKAVELGKERQLHHPFLYPNYANSEQDVFSGFSAENLKRLEKIQMRYDPGALFARLQTNSRVYRS